MGRWVVSGRSLRCGLGASGVVVMLLAAACDDKQDGGNAAAPETVAPAAESTASVSAPAIDPTEAPAIEKAIASYLELAAGPASQRVLHFGAVKVTPGSDAFNVSIENVVIGPKNAGEWIDRRLEVGTVGYRLAPNAARDGYRATDLTYPADMPVLERDGKKAGSVAMKTKTFSADWSTAIGYVLGVDWKAADFLATSTGADGTEVRIGELAWDTASTDKGNGIFDQVSQFTLSGLKASDTAEGTFTVGKIGGSGGYTDINLKEFSAKTREIQKMVAEAAARDTATGNTAATVPAAPVLTGEQAGQLGSFIKNLSGLVGGMAYEATFEDVRAVDTTGGESFSLAKGSLNIGASSLNAEKARIDFGLSHEGLKLGIPELTANPLAARLLPAAGKLDLDLTDVPARELWRLVGENFPGFMTADPAMSEAAAGAMTAAMLQLLQKAPMKLTIAPSGLQAEVMQLDANGLFDIRPDAAVGLVGVLDVTLHGIDEAMKLANEAAQGSPDAAQFVGMLAMIQSMAKRETGEDGKPVDRLKVEVDATGATKVNGMPLSGM